MGIKDIFNFFSKKEEATNDKLKFNLLSRVKRLILICDILIGKLNHKLDSPKEGLYNSLIKATKDRIELTKSHLEGVYKSLEELNLRNIDLIIKELKEVLSSIMSNKNELIKVLINIKKFNRDDFNNIRNIKKEIIDLIKILNALKNNELSRKSLQSV